MNNIHKRKDCTLKMIVVNTNKIPNHNISDCIWVESDIIKIRDFITSFMISAQMSRLIQVIVIVSAGGTMGVTYKKLFKLLIDRNMKKKDLRDLAGIGNSTMTKLSNDENVTIEVMAKICRALDCTIDDVVEIVPDDL